MLRLRTTTPRALINDLLPTEVKAKIFSLAHIDAVTYHGPPIFSKNHPSVAISHVCKEWRELALSTPQLWDDLHIVFQRRIVQFCEMYHTDETHLEDNEGYAVEDNLERLRCKLIAWLDRSGTRPLTVTGISVTGMPEFDEGTNLFHEETDSQDERAVLSAFDRVRMVIASSIQRWAHIEPPLGTPGGQIDTRAIHYTEYILKFLRWTDRTNYIPELVPNLKSLKIALPGRYNSDHSSIFSSLAAYRWDALQCLSLRDIEKKDLDDILELLQSCPNLITLELHRIPLGSPTPYTGQKRVTLPRLHSVVFTGTALAPGLHEVFILPVLQSFTFSASLLTLPEGNDEWKRTRRRETFHVSLTQWMERFGRGLAELNLIDTGDRIPSDRWLVERLTANLIPNLTHLRSIGRTDCDSLLQTLAFSLPSGEPRPCCPRLQEFVSVTNPRFLHYQETLSEKAALNFLAARLSSGTGSEASGKSVCKIRLVEFEVMDGDKVNIIEELTNRGPDLKNVTIKMLHSISFEDSYRYTIDFGALVDKKA